MITSDADVAIEREVLPVYVLKDQDDIARATAFSLNFRFVALHHIKLINKPGCGCVCLTASLV